MTTTTTLPRLPLVNCWSTFTVCETLEMKYKTYSVQCFHEVLGGEVFQRCNIFILSFNHLTNKILMGLMDLRGLDGLEGLEGVLGA